MVGVLCGEANKRTMCIGLDKWLVRRVAVLRETFSTINIILFELREFKVNLRFWPGVVWHRWTRSLACRNPAVKKHRPCFQADNDNATQNSISRSVPKADPGYSRAMVAFAILADVQEIVRLLALKLVEVDCRN